ncbi:hypothetical protein ACHQM5_022376 [Ranunculus cassubicifolius]
MNLLGIGTILFRHKSSSSSSSSGSSHSSSMEVPSQITDLEPGLKSLTSPSNFNHSSCVNRTSLHSPLSSFSSDMEMSKQKKRTREFPPPIHLLARTENLPCHMPWVLKRCYIDGRLVLHEVPVKHHECFKAHRSNGRLVLRMMYMTDDHHQSNPTQSFDHDVISNERNVNEEVSPPLMNVEENREEGDVKADAVEDLDVSVSPLVAEQKNLQNDLDPIEDEEQLCVSPLMAEHKNLQSCSDPKQEEQEDVCVSPLVAEHKNLQNSLDSKQEDVCVSPLMIEHKSLRNGSERKQEEEEEVSVSPLRAEHKSLHVEQLQRVLLNETRIYSSSMPEGRLGCSPKGGRNNFFKISTPTIRPIYS